MDITKAKKVVGLTKGDRKMMVTVYEGGQVSSCVEAGARKYCETCQADDETCQEWIEHLKEKGYEATEIELGELELEESLPKFLEQREAPIEVPEEAPVEVPEEAPIEVPEGAPVEVRGEAPIEVPAEEEEVPHEGQKSPEGK